MLPDWIFWVYCAGMACLLTFAVLYAVILTGPIDLDVPPSLDCRNGVHGGCPLCSCGCHWSGVS